MPRISIIVPVYNVEAYLDRCINSILEQSFDDFELILVDDGSTDNCPSICDSYTQIDSRIRVLHQDNKGLSAARNVGIQVSRGDYITFVDSDDWISKNMLKDLWELIIKYKADIVSCELLRTSTPIDYSDQKHTETLYSRDEFMDIILKINSNKTMHYACGKLYNREVLDDHHFPEGMLNEDVEGAFKSVIRSERIVVTTAKDYSYFINNMSITHRRFGENFLCLVDVWKRVLDISKCMAPQYTEKVAFNLMRIDFTILTESIIYGDRETDKIYRAELLKIRKRLKTNIFKLIKGPMVFHRKLLALAVCYLYYPIRQCQRLGSLMATKLKKQ